MANEYTDVLFPPGRLIQGDLYKGSDKDSKGLPRLVKNGPSIGKPLTQFFIGVAIPKAGEQHWSQTGWGQKMLTVGAAAYPNFYQNPAFAWKVEDGDSTVPNKSNRRPCDAEGAKGHWIVKFSRNIVGAVSEVSSPIRVFQQPTPGTFVEVTGQSGLIKRGYWVQVSGSLAGNTGESPGIYVNADMVLFVRADAEITSGPDAATAFAGAQVSQALPGAVAGASAMPFQAAAQPPALPGAGAGAGAPALPAAAAPAGVVVAPNPAFLAAGVPGTAAAPAMPMAPALPAAPAAPAVPQMTPAGVATGFTIEQFRQANWSDAQLRQAGYIV